MTNLREGAIIVSLIDALNQRGSFCGETHVQKGAYFLRELLNVPLESSFTLYLYGPYSFPLHHLLNELHAEQLVALEPREMGASWRPGERYALLRQSYPTTLKRFRRQVEFVADKIAKLRVVDLEPLATALYVNRTERRTSLERRVSALRKVKRHLDESTARNAFETIDEWEREVRKIRFTEQD